MKPQEPLAFHLYYYFSFSCFFGKKCRRVLFVYLFYRQGAKNAKNAKQMDSTGLLGVLGILGALAVKKIHQETQGLRLRRSRFICDELFS